jgi:diaminopimelate epimerase
MIVSFAKYQGAGNDFVIIDNRQHIFDRTKSALIAGLCDRKFGIGADGLMLLENKSGYDFEMVYFNSDGKPSSMCGNGGRCIVSFSTQVGITTSHARFLAVDGAHEAFITEHVVKLKMNDVSDIEQCGTDYFLNTGSPHYVKMVEGLDKFDVSGEGRRIRNSERFLPGGTNVNFIEPTSDALFVRTYERGVEAETLSCGTGVTASALVAAFKGWCGMQGFCEVKTLGGNLKVYFARTGKSSFSDVWLEGPAMKVYEGTIDI